MPCSRSSRRSAAGVTLVEAVLGAALLGSLLVSVLVGASRLQAQAARAEARIEALAVADRLLKTWWAEPETFPRRGAGRLEDGWTWRTQVRPSEAARDLGGEVVRVDLFRPEARTDDPDVTVEVFLPKADTDATRPDAG